MSSRNHKAEKKMRVYSAGIETFIERLKKIRALNCSPSDVGIDSSAVSKVSFTKRDIFTKSF